MILYLDFDGVLHPDSVYLEQGKPVLVHDENTKGSESLFEWAPLLAEVLRPFPGVRIVLSTSWVPTIGFDVSKSYLPPGLQQRVVGATWHSKYTPELHGIMRRDWSYVSRYEQIRLHRDFNNPAKWLAIDNDADGWNLAHKDKLIHTDDWMGLGEQAKIEELVSKLSGANK